MKKSPSKKRKTFRLLDLFMLLFLIGGILLLAYPFVSDALNDFLDQQLITIYQHKANSENKAIIEKATAEMKKKNTELAKNNAEPGMNAYTEAIAAKKKEKADKNYYQKHTIAILKIPKINLSLPIFDETNEYFLQKGVSLLEGTSYPIGGADTHAVLSGHRGLPQAALFTNLPKLKLGDKFYLEINKEHHAYKVDNIQTIEPSDTEPLQIQAGKDLVTLMTCTPYMVNTDRLLVTGHRVPYTAKDSKKLKRVSWLKAHLIYLWIAAGIVGLLLLAWILRRWFIVCMPGRRQYLMQFYLTDGKGPLTGEQATIFTKNKKHAVKRDDNIVTAIADEAGLMDFGNLPGGRYQIKFDTLVGKPLFLKAHVKKVGSRYFTYRSDPIFQLVKNKESQLPKVRYHGKESEKYGKDV